MVEPTVPCPDCGGGMPLAEAKEGKLCETCRWLYNQDDDDGEDSDD